MNHFMLLIRNLKQHHTTVCRIVILHLLKVKYYWLCMRFSRMCEIATKPNECNLELNVSTMAHA